MYGGVHLVVLSTEEAAFDPGVGCDLGPVVLTPGKSKDFPLCPSTFVALCGSFGSIIQDHRKPEEKRHWWKIGT